MNKPVIEVNAHAANNSLTKLHAYKKKVTRLYWDRKGHVMDDCIVLRNDELDACKHENIVKNKPLKRLVRNVSNAYFYCGKRGHYMHNYNLMKQENQTFRKIHA